jgi:hypothetical protein
MKVNFQIREDDMGYQSPGGSPNLTVAETAHEIPVTLLTGGSLSRGHYFWIKQKLSMSGRLGERRQVSEKA